MNKKWKKVGALAFAGALAGSLLLAGCAGSGSGDSADNAGAASGDQATQEPVQIQIFAANSLQKAMDEAIDLYEAEHPGVTFADPQYLASGDLVAQLEGGAPADLLITASKGTMDTAVEKGLVDDGTRFDMFRNDLVVIAPADSDIDQLELADIASGDYTVTVGSDSVPAGNYANQALSTVGCFNDPEGKVGAESKGKSDGTDAYAGTPLEGKVNLVEKVGDVATQVGSGSTDLGFVYTSDVSRFADKGIKVVCVVPADTHKNIVYPAAVVANTENAQAVGDFLEWASTDEGALAIWQEWNFELVTK